MSKMHLSSVFASLAAITGLMVTVAGAAMAQTAATPTHGWWPDDVEKAIARSGTNRGEIVAALNGVPKAQREGITYLVENMPTPDLESLSSKYLIENVGLAYAGLAKAPWKKSIPKALFLNDVLPYSCLNEARDDSRKMLQEKSLPLITDCRSPAEAAERLNQKLFPLFNAKYSTERHRPDQAPLETIASGKATCTGLSILLVDACRAVGIPARLAGTPMWTNLRGNHTWVEIWDGEWHFTGAAEPDPNGMDRGWFTHDASLALKNVPEHAIYASSFKKADISFPLPWAPDITWVGAVNVTDRYTAKVPVDSGATRVLIRVVDANGKRVAATVTARMIGTDKPAFTGSSKDETADLNDILAFEVLRTCPPRKYEISVEHDGHTTKTQIEAPAAAQGVFTVAIP